LTGDGITLERDGAVAIVMLDRPQVMNRFEGLMREELQRVLGSLAVDHTVRCVVITGAGPAFSAGADLEELIDLHRRGRVEEIGRRVRLGSEIVGIVQRMDKPVVAAVNGVAAGAGCNLALACDMRVGSDRAVFVESFVRIGLVPDWGGFQNLVRLVGVGHAADLMMTGARVDAEQALTIGILQRVFPEPTFWDDVLAYAQQLATGPPEALALIKRGVELGARCGLDQQIGDFEESAQQFAFERRNALEGLQAFVEKRRPHFVAISGDCCAGQGSHDGDEV
jgi:2-(1,2-epoxy-1,2-dihydrophenyl)acetyl-CoA isomerase